jgi:DNA-directed RNA polymerase specialized sigma24 family protein
MRNPKGRPGRKPSGTMTSRTADAGGPAAGGPAAGVGPGGHGRVPRAEGGTDLAARLAELAARMEEMAPLYQEHYRSLVRLAALLVSDLAAAEEIVQEAFAEAHGRWSTLPDHDAALRYLRQSLIRRSRTMTQFQPVSDTRAAGLPASGGEAIVLAALRALPARQREVLVLRYFADLPEAEIAAVTGTRIAVVRGYATRGMSSLRTGLPGNVA